MSSEMYIIQVTEDATGTVVYDISIEHGVGAALPKDATQRTRVLTNIRKDLLKRMLPAWYTLAVLPAPPPELSEARKRLCHSIFSTAVEGGIGYWSKAMEYHWAKPEASPEMSVDASADIDGFFAVILETENQDGDTGEYPKHRIDLAVIDRGINRLASREATNGGDELLENGHWHTLALALNAEGAEDVDFDASDADAIVQAGLFNDIVYG